MTRSAALPASGFGAFVARARAAGVLVVQPRMGMADPLRMREGLLATRGADAVTVGTITLDSYTRTGDLAAARRALAEGVGLNGYPIATHPADTTRAVLRGIADPRFPVQVRHGSAAPEHIVRALLAAGLDATEGGPVSYCLPYSRTPLREAVEDWRRSCELLAATRELGAAPHLETFGGCLMGQLCPPSLLIAVSVLEALFFRQHGLRDLSLSYAQQADPRQDEEALTVLGRLAAELLPDVDHHLVLYAYMGVFPRSPGGARLLLEDAARLAVRAGAARLIVKTTAEAHRIPTVEENVRALEAAAAAAAHEHARLARSGAPGPYGPGLQAVATGSDDTVRAGTGLVGTSPVGRTDGTGLVGTSPVGRTDGTGLVGTSPVGRTAGTDPVRTGLVGTGHGPQVVDTGIEAEARALIGAVLDLDADIGRALVRAFAAGYLDVPYCLHPDNAGRARSSLTPDGRLHWSNTGSMPLAGLADGGPRPPILGSAGLLSALSHVQRTYDARAAARPAAETFDGAAPVPIRTPAAPPRTTSMPRRELGLTTP
ncbi:methylaspartate mutase [Streptomyces roseoviridis]|uniref:Methylaspartate mutase n=1 Tax=Streptomyces roseoviridis TaxID=67361 RepID=A0ABV5QU72_9ACTN